MKYFHETGVLLSISVLDKRILHKFKSGEQVFFRVFRFFPKILRAKASKPPKDIEEHFFEKWCRNITFCTKLF